METKNKVEQTPFQKAFAHNLAIRPCGFDPSENFDVYEDVEQGRVKFLLGLDYKKLWFHSYCQNNNVSGRYEDDDYIIQIFEAAGTGMVSAKARVYLNDACVGTGCASKGFYLNNPQSMESVIQNATGSALSRALSNAGFGAICSNEPDVLPGGNLTPVNLPYHVPDGLNSDPAAQPSGGSSEANQPPVNTNPGQNPMSGPGGQNVNAPGANQYQNPATGNPGQQYGPGPNSRSQQAPAHAPQVDPVKAKSVLWPCSGYYAGKTLGEVLAVAPAKIMWLAEEYKKACEAKYAAKVLLPEARRACGK